MKIYNAWVQLIALFSIAKGQGDCPRQTELGDLPSRPLYQDAQAPAEARIRDIIGRMTLNEKMAQLMQGSMESWINIKTGAFDKSGLEKSMLTKASQFYVGYPISWESMIEGIGKAQEYLINNTSAKTPAFVQTEGIHGLLALNATIFNSPIGQACSFNPELVEKMAGVIAQEARALGINQIFGPVADLARELRFGRVEETFGEDSFLAGEMAYSYVKGLQAGKVSAVVKHFVGFSAPEQGLNTGPVHGGERELRTTWLPPFRRAIVDGGAYGVMSGYHSYDGSPAIADRWTLTDILRNEWGYKYFVISDAGATDRLCTAFRMCRAAPMDHEAVTMYALIAGNDVEMGGGSFNFRAIPGLVNSGKLNVRAVDQAVSRVLRAKFDIGLFDTSPATLNVTKAKNLIHTSDAVQLARQLDTESIVLLENRNGLLPLKPNANIAVIGPMGHGYMNYGDYVVKGSMNHGVTPYEGIKRLSNGTVTFTKGCERWSNDQTGFPEALSAVKAADIAVVVVGTWSRDQNELWSGVNATTGEHVDVSSLKLVGAMGPLVKAIMDTGKPTVVVYSSGKPITEPWISKRVGALVQQFYPSEEGGHALADILFGVVNPSGRLAVSIPYDLGTTPVYYDYLNSGRSVDPGEFDSNGSMQFGHQYVDNSPEALYEFGYGKSYSTFTYSNLTLSPKTATSPEDVIKISVRIWNTGKRDGTEVVQLYVEDLISSVVVPNKLLKGFKKVFIKAGEFADVGIPLKVQELGLWNSEYKYVVEPGEFRIWVGSSSKDLKSKAILTVHDVKIFGL